MIDHDKDKTPVENLVDDFASSGLQHVDYDEATRIAERYLAGQVDAALGGKNMLIAREMLAKPCKLAKAYLELKAENEKYRSALQWYADCNHIDFEVVGGDANNAEPLGQHARKVLEGNK